MNSMTAIKNNKLNWPASRFLLVYSLLIALVFNFPFISRVYSAVAPQTVWEWLFVASAPVLLTSLIILLLSLLGGLFFPRVAIAISTVVSATLFYATVNYGVVFDLSMFENVMQTDSGEASAYLNSSLFIYLAVSCLIPLLIIARTELRGGFKHQLKGVLLVNAGALVCVVIVGALFYKDYATVGRNHKSLTKYLTPFAFYDAGRKYLRDHYFYPPLEFKVLDEQPMIAQQKTSAPRKLVIVVGETARAQNFALNNYPRPTTPNLERHEVVNFPQVISCGTATAVSVPCMFSRLDREEYDTRQAEAQDNVLDILKRAGSQVVWIDNNSSCKGVCKRVETIDYDPARDDKLCDGDYCFDEVLLPLLDNELTKHPNETQIIVLHMIGSHGPTYYRRYPAEFKRFTPDCPRSDIQNCSEEELLNTYDNTIAYTDFVLSEVIERLQNIPNSAMLYVSDHGESLGEKGMYLHGFPYSIAPEEQTHVPMVYWDQHLADQAYRDCATNVAEQPLSQDNVFDIILDLAHVDSTTYEAEMDVLNQCHQYADATLASGEGPILHPVLNK